MKPARVTWLLPVKNGMPYLRETLESIEAQTFKDWELFAWDNGSTDGTQELLQAWVPARVPGRLWLDKPCGLGASLRDMVVAAETPFCARIDADDVNYPTRLQKQLDFVDAHPDHGIVGTRALVIDQDGAERGPGEPLPLDHKDLVHRLLLGWALYHPSVLFRRDVILKAGNYRDIMPGQDYDLWMRVATCAKLANLEEPLIKYRVHSNSVTGRNAERQAEVIRSILIRNATALYGLSEKTAARLVQKQLFFAFPTFLGMARYLSGKTNSSVASHFSSTFFLIACYSFTRRRDFATRTLLRLLQFAKSTI